jgi:hypothetical protein
MSSAITPLDNDESVLRSLHLCPHFRKFGRLSYDPGESMARKLISAFCMRCAIPAMAISIACLFLSVTSAHAQASDVDLRKEVQSPVSGLTNVSISNNLNFDAGPLDRNAYSLQIQPVLPFQISKDWLVVPRVLINAVVYQPDLLQSEGGTTGFGDTTPTFFFSPTHAGGLIWGIGPSLLMPTATNSASGNGKWGLGPSVAVFWQPKWGTIGGIVQNVWSFAGDPKRARVNQMALELFGQFNLPKNWYLSTQPEIDANWNEKSEDRWLVPVGGGIGKIFSIGKQSLDGTLLFYRNVVRPEMIPSAKWQLTAQLALLYPKK